MMLDIAALRPALTDAEAIELARDRYGISAVSVHELPSDRDQNFYLEAADGSALVLKITSAGDDDEVLDFQNRALLHLAGCPELRDFVPQLLRSKNEALTEKISGQDGRTHAIRMLTFLAGVPLAKVNPQTPALLEESGQLLGRLDQALLDFTHPAMARELHWDLAHASQTLARYAPAIKDLEKRAMVDRFLAQFEAEVVPLLPGLRRSVIHSDGNDYNFLVSADRRAPRHLAGLVDFGDIVFSCTIFEPAIAAAYLMMDKDNPARAAAAVVAGYHAVFPLTEQEIALLPALIAIRLCISVAISAYQQDQEPDNAYLVISERPAWDLLARLAEMPPGLLHFQLRAACGLEPYPDHAALVGWLQANRDSFAPLLVINQEEAMPLVFDWSVGSEEVALLEHTEGMDQLSTRLFERLRKAKAALGVGRYNEARLVYATEAFVGRSGQRRTIHIGLDLFAPAGTPVQAPLPGRVHSFRDNDAPLDYGPSIILAHHTADAARCKGGPAFYTLVGHLSRDSLAGLRVGQVVEKGQEIGRIGEMNENGGWPPHLHFQIMGDLLGYEGDFPGVAPADSRETWLSLCPDPNLIARLPGVAPAAALIDKEEIMAQRAMHLGPSLSLSYQKPLEILRGRRQYLYDETGRRYLDVVNNVCHVGHSHPRVVRALAGQAAVLNTNTRYLHPNIVRFADRLLATLPEPLEVCFFVCSGSEANELALRLARTFTGAEDFIVIDGAYHGNTAALIDISPYKHDGPGGQGTPAHIHKAQMPDPYRGIHKGYGQDVGRAYARHVQELAQGVLATGRGLAGFIAEPVLGCGGQIVLPEDYLAEAFAHVRTAGGVCIVDEVQVGFGRVGSHFWAFQTQGVVPDIVTMGKPIGNGHPLAAVVTTRAIADAFANGMEYFNTFGGNPVSCAVGSAVLEVIAGEGLQENALRVGARLLQGLQGLMARHALIGDVRGLGLFIGVELVRDRETLEPAAEEATYIVERMKEHGILLSIDGPLHNVLKLKPPLVFSMDDADLLVRMLDKVLAEDAVS